MNFYLILTLVIVVLTSIGQLLLKIGATHALVNGKNVYFQPASVVGYALFALVAFLSIIALKGLDLKVFFVLISLTYISIPLLAHFILKETMTKNRIIGIIVIAAGVVIFYL